MTMLTMITSIPRQDWLTAAEMDDADDLILGVIRDEDDTLPTTEWAEHFEQIEGIRIPY